MSARLFPKPSLFLTLSPQSLELLEAIAARGIYGRDSNEVARRFIDKALEQFVEPLRIKARRTR